MLFDCYEVALPISILNGDLEGLLLPLLKLMLAMAPRSGLWLWIILQVFKSIFIKINITFAAFVNAS